MPELARFPIKSSGYGCVLVVWNKPDYQALIGVGWPPRSARAGEGAAGQSRQNGGNGSMEHQVGLVAGWNQGKRDMDNDPTEAITESVKALREVAETGGKLIDASGRVGGWLDRIFGQGIEDTVALHWSDRIPAVTRGGSRPRRPDCHDAVGHSNFYGRHTAPAGPGAAAWSSRPARRRPGDACAAARSLPHQSRCKIIRHFRSTDRTAPL